MPNLVNKMQNGEQGMAGFFEETMGKWPFLELPKRLHPGGFWSACCQVP